MKVKVISLPYIFQVLYVSYFTRPRYQVSVYRTIGPLVSAFLDRILFILAGDDNIHGSLDEFEILSDPIAGFHGNRYGYDGKNGVSTF